VWSFSDLSFSCLVVTVVISFDDGYSYDVLAFDESCAFSLSSFVLMVCQQQDASVDENS